VVKSADNVIPDYAVFSTLLCSFLCCKTIYSQHCVHIIFSRNIHLCFVPNSSIVCQSWA